MTVLRGVVRVACVAGMASAFGCAPGLPSDAEDAAGAPPSIDAGTEPLPLDAAAPSTDADIPSPAPDAAITLADPVIEEPGLPLIHNYSTASRAHIVALVRTALDGLGFDPSTGQGPNPQDRAFIGNHYVAWIDQTGFHGKMNGLWRLNGAAGDALDFVVADPDGRPVNVFMPGEDGEGRWPNSYKGAEHIEFPSRFVEPGDSCGGDWCNQYSLNEAPLLDNDRIQHWTACNAGSIGFDALFEPVVLEDIPGGIKLVYEGRLVKEADGDGDHDGDNCHADYPFPQDGVRRPVYLRLGYELRGDVVHIDRTMQLRNPAGNPELAGDMSLIGGFVMTGWPTPHYLKRFQRFWRPELRSMPMSWGDAAMTLVASAWNDLSLLQPVDRDVLVGWIDQPLSLSAVAAYAPGMSATLSHVGPSDNADVGACLCTVHGAIELGGGLVHAGISLPIAGGASTVEARRRLSLPGTGSGPSVTAHAFEAETSLAHGVGRAIGDGWQATTASDVAGHLAYGPYATDWGAGAAQAVFYLLVDNNTAANDVVVTLEINDATSDRVLATREVRRHEFRAAHAYQRFSLNMDLSASGGHSMETRVFWHDVSLVKLDKVVVNVVSASPP